MSSAFHQACYFLGVDDVVVSQVLELLREQHHISVVANPDFTHLYFETFGIDDARILAEAAYQRSVGSDQVFLLRMQKVTLEAQNALLKLLEEPPPATRILIGVPTHDVLLPTVRSRLQQLAITNQSVSTASFLGLPLAERMNVISDLIEEKDGLRVQALMDGLERELADHSQHIPTSVIREFYRTKRYLSGRSPSRKQLLEHIAIVVPVL